MPDSFEELQIDSLTQSKFEADGKPLVPASERQTATPNEVGWTCRFHPTDWWHEVGCPHQEWTKEQLYDALLTKKRFETSRIPEFVKDLSERQELREKVAELEACTHCGGPDTSDKDCMCGGTGKRSVQIKGLYGCIQYWRKLHHEVSQENTALQATIQRLERKIEGAYVCCKCRGVKRNGVTSCPACINGVTWPKEEN